MGASFDCINKPLNGEFLAGKSPYAIARGLTEEGIPSPAGKPRWNDLTIKRVLSNETYMGDKLLQKTYSNDFLDKTRRKNEGQLIDQNARVAQDQDDYQRRYDEMFTRYEDAEKALAAAQESLHQKETRNEQIEDFISEIQAMPDSISEFRTDYWGHLVERVTVHRKGAMAFSFTCRVGIKI